MNLDSFRNSIKSENAPTDLSPYLLSLWYDAKGDWNKAHDIIREKEDEPGSWIHAYLHRKEGDIWNADYWYRRAGRKRPSVSLNEEWEQIVQEFLKK